MKAVHIARPTERPKEKIMLEWIADKLGIAAVFPWPRVAVSFLLGIVSSLILWAISDIPWPNIMLGVSVALSLWTLAESIGHPIKGFGAGLIAFWLSTGTTAVQKTIQNAPVVKCVYFDRLPAETCRTIELQREKSNG